MVHVALAAVEAQGIDAEVIDLRTLVPLDIETIEESVEEDRPLPRRPRSDAHLAASAPSSPRWSRSAASTTSKRRSSASPAGTRPIRTRYEWAYFPGPKRMSKALEKALDG